MSTHLCVYHQRRFEKQLDYNQHMSICQILLDDPITCEFKINGVVCMRRFDAVSNLVIHYYTQHQKYLCCSCGKTYETAEDMDKHEHTGDTHLNVFESECVYVYQ